MKNFEELENFIKEHDDWKELLKKAPYRLKSITQFPYNENWYLLNYNLFESDLSDKIVRQCRGTCVEVIGKNVKVICAPYLKFFNIDEEYADKINWQSKKLKCQSKIDGQLEKCFKYNGRDYWVTNGGVSNDTPLDYTTEEISNYKELLAKCFGAKKAMITENDFRLNMPWIDNVPDDWTLMFEITSPQNKIICEYENYKAWFHGARDPDGNEHSPEEVKKMFRIPYDIPKRYSLSKKDEILAALNEMNGKKNEGFVVVDEENWTRVKMKCPSYLALKYIRDNDTPEGIWRLCISESYDDFPSLQEKVNLQLQELKTFKGDFLRIMGEAKKTYENMENRKEFALWVNANVPNCLRSSFFKMADGMTEDESFEFMIAYFKRVKDSYEAYVTLLNTCANYRGRI